MKIKDIISYLQGNIRYFCYHKKYLNWMIPKHIKEQYVYRINSMDKECYDNGSCKECGCKTTHLQFANKACDGFCYPEMVNRKRWLGRFNTPGYPYSYGKNYYVRFSISHVDKKFIRYEK